MIRKQPTDWLEQAAETIGATPQPFDLTDRKSFPRISGVYFVEADGALLYLGATACVRARWSGHHRYDQLVSGCGGRLWVIETPDHVRWEPVLIRRLCPKFNGQKVPPLPLTSEQIAKRAKRMEELREESKLIDELLDKNTHPFDILRELLERRTANERG